MLAALARQAAIAKPGLVSPALYMMDALSRDLSGDDSLDGYRRDRPLKNLPYKANNFLSSLRKAMLGLAADEIAFGNLSIDQENEFSSLLSNIISLQSINADPVDNYPEDNAGMALFLMMGQSNMSGRSVVDDGIKLINNGHVWNYSMAGFWAMAKEPLNEAKNVEFEILADPAAEHGPGLYIANYISGKYRERDIGLVYCAKGGTRLVEWLKPEGVVSDSLYSACLARLKAANVKGRFEGVFFYQGETDAKSRSDAMAWPDNFSKLVSDLRKDLSDPGMPVVYAQIGNFNEGGANYPAWGLLQQLQASINIPGVIMIKTSDLVLMDNVHVAAVSQPLLGFRFATAFEDAFPQRLTEVVE